MHTSQHQGYNVPGLRVGVRASRLLKARMYICRRVERRHESYIRSNLGETRDLPHDSGSSPASRPYVMMDVRSVECLDYFEVLSGVGGKGRIEGAIRVTSRYGGVWLVE